MGQTLCHLTRHHYSVTQFGFIQKRPPFNKRAAVVEISMAEILTFL